jgi:hypothetical protein
MGREMGVPLLGFEPNNQPELGAARSSINLAYLIPVGSTTKGNYPLAFILYFIMMRFPAGLLLLFFLPALLSS